MPSALAGEGVKVVLTFRKQEELMQLKKEVENEGGTALLIPTDVSRPEEGEAMVKQTPSW